MTKAEMIAAIAQAQAEARAFTATPAGALLRAYEAAIGHRYHIESRAYPSDEALRKADQAETQARFALIDEIKRLQRAAASHEGERS